MTVEAGVPKNLGHGEAEEATQLNIRLVKRKKESVFNIANLP